MLHLKVLTPPEWAQAALSDVNALLLDHAFCEEKAAASARMLLKGHPKLERPLAALAKEEDGHARLCRGFLRERGVAFTPPHRDAYVSQLRHRGLGRGRGDLLDKLIVASLIEARSCERFKLLAAARSGDALGRFYEDLFAAEARHHALFLDLASDLFGENKTRSSLDRLATIEAQVVASRPWGPRVH